MKRAFYLFLCVAACYACEKNDAPAMDVADLHGTYWIERHYYTTCCENGEYVTTDTHEQGLVGGSACFLHFSDDGRVTEYVQPNCPPRYYRTYSFDYYPQWRQFRIDGVFYEMTGFSHERIAWRYKTTDCLGRAVEIERVFEPWKTTSEWLNGIATWPSYDEVDWAQYR